MAPHKSRYKITMCYKGPGFFGWQKQNQPGQISVQGELEKVLATLYQTPVRVIGAGRTDRGAHALAQTAHFDLPAALSEEEAKELLFKFNRLTPQELLVYQLQSVPPRFHAQLWTLRRTYKYVLLQKSQFPRPLWGDLVGFTPQELPLERLNRGAQVFLGTHDFKSFQTAGAQVPHTERTLTVSSWEQKGDFFIYTVTANGFLRQMVRNLVATQLFWAAGGASEDSLKKILSAKDRGQVPPSADPEGLYLYQVDYGAENDAKSRTLARLPFEAKEWPFF